MLPSAEIGPARIASALLETFWMKACVLIEWHHFLRVIEAEDATAAAAVMTAREERELFLTGGVVALIGCHVRL